MIESHNESTKFVNSNNISHFILISFHSLKLNVIQKRQIHLTDSIRLANSTHFILLPFNQSHYALIDSMLKIYVKI